MHTQNLRATTVIMVSTATTPINIMQINTLVKHMIMIKKISLIITLIFVTGCSLSPGMHMETKSPWLDESKYVLGTLDIYLHFNITVPSCKKEHKNYFLGLTEQFFSTRNRFLPPKKEEFWFFGA